MDKCVSDHALHIRESLELKGYFPSICIDPLGKSEIRVPGTNIQYEWEVIQSTFSVQDKEYAQNEILPTSEPACVKPCFVLVYSENSKKDVKSLYLEKPKMDAKTFASMEDAKKTYEG